MRLHRGFITFGIVFLSTFACTLRMGQPGPAVPVPPGGGPAPGSSEAPAPASTDQPAPAPGTQPNHMQIAELPAAACATSTKRCESLSDCSLGVENCAQGHCYPIADGCPCVDDSGCPQPGSHCGQGVCYPDELGARCDGDNPAECGLGTELHCAKGLCYPNKTGAPCGGVGECGTESSCVDGVCN